MKTKLTEMQEKEIIELYSTNRKEWTQMKLAGKFNVSQPTISNVLKRLKVSIPLEILIPQFSPPSYNTEIVQTENF